MTDTMQNVFRKSINGSYPNFIKVIVISFYFDIIQTLLYESTSEHFVQFTIEALK